MCVLARRRLLGLCRRPQSPQAAFLIVWVRDPSWPFRVALARERENLARRIAAIDGLFAYYERDGRAAPPPEETGMDPIVVHRDGRPWLAIVPAATVDDGPEV